MPQGRHTPAYQPDVMALGNDSFSDFFFGTGEEQLFISDQVRKGLLQAVDQVSGMKDLGVFVVAVGRDAKGGYDSAAKWGKTVLRNPLRPGLAKVAIMFGPPPSQPPAIPEPSKAQRVLQEAASLLLSCGSAAVCWVGVVGGGLAAPEIGGVSIAFSVYVGTSAITGSVQCVEGLARTIIAATDKGRERLEYLDSDKMALLQNINIGLDAFCLFGGVLIGRETLKAFAEARKTNTHLPALFKTSLTRQEARAFMDTLLANGSKDLTAITAQLEKQLLDYISLGLGAVGSARDDNGVVRLGFDALGKALNYAKEETVQITAAIVG